MSPPDDFIIFHRAIQGMPTYIYSYDSRLAACLTQSVNICREYLRHPTIQAALVSFAKEYDRSAPQNAWYKDPERGPGSPEGAVFAFIKIILAAFPLIAVDDTVRNPDFLAAVAKREHHHFDPLDYPISLNGPRVADMVAAATKAWDIGNHHDRRQLCTFIFIFANTLFHEVCHLLSTFLGKGRTCTPPHINAEMEGYSKKDRGEAGRYIETLVFGGTLEYMRNPMFDDRQPGIPCICTNDSLRRITQKSIDDIVRYKSYFPYGLEDPSFKWEQLESLGRYHSKAEYTDPMNWPVMEQFKRYKHRVTWHPDPAFKRPLIYPDLGAQDAGTRAPMGYPSMMQ